MNHLKAPLHYSLILLCVLLPVSGQAKDAVTESENSAGTGGDDGVPLATANPTQYSSPYQIHFSYTTASLQQDFDSAPRNSAAGESDMSISDWYNKSLYTDDPIYGPSAAQFPNNAYEKMPLQWQRERIIATALRYLNVSENLPYDGVNQFGINYRHHHIPAFNPIPSDDWPALNVNGAYPIPADGHGMDCSNFTAWCYNYGLSLQFTADVASQGALTTINNYGGASTPQIPVEKIVAKKGETIAALAERLETGDLLYIENAGSGVAHTVIWVGDIGGVDTSKLNASGQQSYSEMGDKVYLIIDSTSDARVDINGEEIPAGPNLRLFQDWYFIHFSHANRYLDADPAQNTLVTLLGGEVSGNDWYGSNWLGWFYSSPADQPWIYHQELGWMAANLSTTTNIWFYNSQLGWTWTSQSLFPYFYRYDGAAWHWLDKSSSDPSVVWNLSTSKPTALN